MSRLIPTPTVDKNGRLTTVHKRADGAAAGSNALAGARPSLGGSAKQDSKLHKIKPKKLTEGSSAAIIAEHLGRITHRSDLEAFINNQDHMTRGPATISDDDAYDYLRKGVGIQDALALQSVGIGLSGIRQFENGDQYNKVQYLPGSLNRVNIGSNEITHSDTGQVVERLQEAGVSAITADKVITNGLQDQHLDRALDEGQLVKLFSKWRYKTTPDHHMVGRAEQDDVIDGFVTGYIPFELLNNKVADLKNVESEIRTINNLNPEGELGLAFQDRDYFIKLADKAAKSIHEFKPMEKIHSLVKEHGMDVLELNDPRMAGIKIYAENGGGVFTYAGVEGGKYIEAVHRIAEDTIDDTYRMSGDDFSGYGGIKSNDAYLRNWELIKLRDAGLSPEESFEMLALRKLSLDQIMVTRQDGVSNTLAEGAL